MNRQSFDRSGFYLIILNSQTTEQSIGHIFRDCWAVHLANVNVLLPDGISAIMYTYFPYTASHCDKAFPVVVKRITATSSMFDVEYFPNKFKNMFQCELFITTTHYRPFTIFENNTDGEITFKGIEIDLLRTVADQLNFTLVIQHKVLNYPTAEGLRLVHELVSISSFCSG